MNRYQQQDRGDVESYARYLASMDAAMRQKVAVTAAHLPCQGRVADMGMGSGSGSDALAALYPRLRVEGVDVNPTMVEMASSHYQRPNLTFRVGDIARPCFPPESLDAVVNSSVLHHVTSYNGYLYAEAARALEAQVEQLRLAGTLVVRDFLAPPAGLVELRLPPPWTELWTKFSRQFRALQPESQRGFSYQDLGADERGWTRLRVEHRLAVEFVLRKDYQQHWTSEILEEYTYFTQAEFEEQFRRLGLRVLVSTPLYNPWIVRNRFEGQFELYDQDGQALDFPPTNYLIVGEKVAAGQGVSIAAVGPCQPAGFLRKSCYRQRFSDRVYDLACRPHPSVDVLPYFVTEQGNLTVLVRHSYRRPIPTLLHGRPTLDGLRPGAYIVEPITAVQGEDPLGETVEKVLGERAGIAPEQIVAVLFGDTHYPSPGGIREEVIAAFAQVAPTLSLGPDIRALDAHQLLRSAQVNGLSDHRLEMHIFALMRRLHIDPGPWLGDQLQAIPSAQPPPAACWEVTPARAFLPHSPEHGPNFLQIQSTIYQELDRWGEVVDQLELESVSPTRLSPLTVTVLPMLLYGETWWVGLDLDDLPAAQAFSGNSCHWLAPAWRLPWEVTRLNQAKTWLAAGLCREYAASALDWAPLGGPYFPSPGLTPELVYPMAVRVHGQATKLKFFPLNELMGRWETLTNGHLRCLLLRAWLAHSGKS